MLCFSSTVVIFKSSFTNCGVASLLAAPFLFTVVFCSVAFCSTLSLSTLGVSVLEVF
jgi:hypothetical protein